MNARHAPAERRMQERCRRCKQCHRWLQCAARLSAGRIISVLSSISGYKTTAVLNCSPGVACKLLRLNISLCPWGKVLENVPSGEAFLFKFCVVAVSILAENDGKLSVYIREAVCWIGYTQSGQLARVQPIRLADGCSMATISTAAFTFLPDILHDRLHRHQLNECFRHDINIQHYNHSNRRVQEVTRGSEPLNPMASCATGSVFDCKELPALCYTVRRFARFRCFENFHVTNTQQIIPRIKSSLSKKSLKCSIAFPICS